MRSQPGFAGHLHRGGEDPVRVPGGGQPGPEVPSTVCTNPGWSKSKPPAAYFHRTSNANRSTASRSDSPSSRCSTITTATIIGGTE
jgi:hypothetical protein